MGIIYSSSWFLKRTGAIDEKYRLGLKVAALMAVFKVSLSLSLCVNVPSSLSLLSNGLVDYRKLVNERKCRT